MEETGKVVGACLKSCYIQFFLCVYSIPRTVLCALHVWTHLILITNREVEHLENCILIIPFFHLRMDKTLITNKK